MIRIPCESNKCCKLRSLSASALVRQLPAAGRHCVCVILIKILIACKARACLCSVNTFFYLVKRQTLVSSLAFVPKLIPDKC